MMQQNIGKLLPIEGYYVIFRGEISTTYFQSLTHLYQPLIGIHAISLYQTLLSENVLRNNPKNPQTHHTLMNYLSLPLDEIYQARLKLEAIGLLTTFKEDVDQGKTYIYQLNPPFSFKEFFSDGMLSQLLQHQLGENKYTDLIETFNNSHTSFSKLGQNVTASFNDVFQTNEGIFKKNNSKDTNFSIDKINNGPSIAYDILDFEWIEQILSQRMLPVAKIMSPKNKKLMTQMVVLYDLTNQDLEKALLWAVSDENLLDIQEFKTACQDLMQTRQKNTDVKQVNSKDGFKFTDSSNSEKTLSKEDQFINMLETISPKQLLEDLSGGNEASSQDLKVIGDVMSQQGLAPGVMNVLIHYVLLKTDMKLTKAYLEKIASHWARKNVTTVRQAMTLAKSESNKYQQWGTNKQQYYKKPSKKEIVPDWFTERKTGEQNENKKKSTSDDQNKEDIEKLLQNYTKNKKSNHL
ncbi:hypothetical protein GH741_09375 [Aquibacillus halophilus]|uniref:Uncharacterized protein n=1 Tax=Aquibacillus halophilus TaxID=930132 RepID=A0A6A8DEF5_9BACI|nr:DnaD domain protein [Aquibacillus halophilus]MRH42896.1 hypothetical protein [Aquibacillus halophilus]